MKLYAAATSVLSQRTAKLITQSVKATSAAEAEGLVMAKAREMYPPSDGWFGHVSYVVEITPEFINTVYPLVGWDGQQEAHV